MSIFEKLTKTIAIHQMATGFTPTTIYLGRTEIWALIRWGIENSIAIPHTECTKSMPQPIWE